MSDEVHHYHHYEEKTPVFNIKLQLSSKGEYYWDISISDAVDVYEALAAIKKVDGELRQEYGRAANQ